MFILLKWNKKYGNGAKFVVQDKSNGKFAEFSPARPKDVAWVDTDISKEQDYSDWDDFGHEEVDDLNKIIM